MPRPRGNRGWLPSGWPTTKTACIWPAGPRPCTRSARGSPPRPARPEEAEAWRRRVERKKKKTEPPDGRLLWFTPYPAPDLLERRARQRTAHAALIAQILESAGSARAGCGAIEPTPRLAEPLSQSELRVLRYLPSNLSAPEIAGELSVSLSTVKTHMRNVYEKLGGHSLSRGRRARPCSGPARTVLRTFELAEKSSGSGEAASSGRVRTRCAGAVTRITNRSEELGA